MNHHIDRNDEMFTQIMNTALDALDERIPREANLDRSSMAADIAEAARQIIIDNAADYIRE